MYNIYDIPLQSNALSHLRKAFQHKSTQGICEARIYMYTMLSLLIHIKVNLDENDVTLFLFTWS